MAVPKYQPFPYDEFRNHLQTPGENSGAQMVALQLADGTQTSVQDGIRDRVTAEAALTAADTTLSGRVTTAEGEIDALQTATGGLIGTPTFVVGAEAGNIIRVTVQLKDAAGENVSGVHCVHAWLSDMSKGTVSGTPPVNGSAIGTAGIIMYEFTAELHMFVLTNATGAFDLDVWHIGARTWYLCVEFGGAVYASGALTFS